MPHLSLLGLGAKSLEDVYNGAPIPPKKVLRGKQAAEPADAVIRHVQWTTAWSDYVRGNVVSKSSERFIQRFLLNTIASAGRSANDVESEADASEDDPDVPPLRIPSMNFHDLLKIAEQLVEQKDGEGHAAGTVGQKLNKAVSKKLQRSLEYEQSHRIGEQVWKTDPLLSAVCDRGTPGNMHEDTWEDHVAALAAPSDRKDAFEAPFEEMRSAAASFVRRDAARNLDNVLQSILQGTANAAGAVVSPNAQQAAFLQHFVRRMKFEVLEMQLVSVNGAEGEPMLDLIHGLPGTGKSAIISWMRRLLEDGLGWEHGVQFVCLAFQNAMAAQISGFTVHHWSGIPARNESGAGTGDRHKQSMKCQALRVVIIDEARG